MDKYRIIGPNRLIGELEIDGAKNAALPIFCGSLLTSDPVFISNVPKLKDVETLLKLFSELGVSIELNSSTATCGLQTASISSLEAPYELVKTMRASILVLGPLLARFGEVKVSLPGGCAIGNRPIDQHIKAFESMGAKVTLVDGYIHAKCRKLNGSRIKNDMVTVTGTENIMMAACLAEGETIIENAAREPEVVDLAIFLKSMGARISGEGTDVISILGVKKLFGAEHKIISDRIETGTFICAIAACGGDVFLRNANINSIGVTVTKLRQSGTDISVDKEGLTVTSKGKPESVSVKTAPFPGFATDMQAQIMAVNLVSNGTARITENIFENRFMHVQEMKRLGAHIKVNGNTAVVTGRERLCGAEVMATDLRASAGLVIAGLVAEGETVIDRIYHLERGYADMDKKLANLGADVLRVNQC
ncbi:MAG: UDP-N-acetylglucosamine 1-carboxyvinyltransferase [Betaproteobacteria bacterium TMED82]|nr:MAG: UDP-N-acetylglucosamine 1-carboxyvinyltransferase [Betaproteobacteria bacterium TMED82]